jgi:phage-related protein
VFEILYYKDRHGKSLVADYLRELDTRKDKDSRIKVNKIYDYIDFLREAGKAAGEPYIKHLDGEIWSLDR